MVGFITQAFAGFINLYCGNMTLGCCFLLGAACCLFMAKVGGDEE